MSFRTWHLVPTALATGLTALVTAGAVGVSLLASPSDAGPSVAPSAPLTRSASPSPSSPPSTKAKRKVRHKVKPTRKPRATPTATKRATPRATRSTSRPLDVRPIAAKALAKAMLAQRGWGGQWSAFNALEMGEAGWNSRAVNPSSGACGLPQALPCSKLPNGVGTPIGGQLTWMLDYIARNYGSPAKAYAAWLSRSPHWY